VATVSSTSDDASASTPPEVDADWELASLLVASARLVNKNVARTSSVGVSNARYELLRVLASGEPQRMGRVAERLAVTPRAVTELSDALEREGLIVRRVDPRDRRSHLLELTERGVAVLGSVGRERVERARHLLAALAPWERAALGGLLAKVVANGDTDE